jgi:hypothetical protein
VGHVAGTGKCEKERRCDNLDWIHLAQNMVQLWTLLDTVMNFLVT